jgi:hypothetical protein
MIIILCVASDTFNAFNAHHLFSVVPSETGFQGSSSMHKIVREQTRVTLCIIPHMNFQGDRSTTSYLTSCRFCLYKLNSFNVPMGTREIPDILYAYITWNSLILIKI